MVLLAALGGLVAPTVAASVATASLWLAGVPIRGPFPEVWATWCLAGGLGILVLGSAGLALAPPGVRRPAPGDAEAVLLGIVTVVITALVFLHTAISPSVRGTGWASTARRGCDSPAGGGAAGHVSRRRPSNPHRGDTRRYRPGA